jgi:hypothetical protein
MIADEVRQKVLQLYLNIVRCAFKNWKTRAQKQAQKKASIALALRLEQEHYMVQPHAMRLEQEHNMVQPHALLEVLAQAKFLVHYQARAQALVNAPAQVSQHQNQILERLAEHLEQAQCLAQAYAQHTQAQLAQAYAQHTQAQHTQAQHTQAQHTQAQQLERQAQQLERQAQQLERQARKQKEEDLNLARQVQEEENLNLVRQLQEEENLNLARQLARQFEQVQAQEQTDSELAAALSTIPDLE